VALILSGVLLYVLLAEALGFIVTAFGLVSFLMWRLSVRWPVALFTSLVLVLVVYQVFAVHLRVPLPRGVLGW
jgi:putative tricarboxylic transport membrane protein